LQSELVLHEPHLPLEHLPTLQSELVLQLPHLPPEHVPLPLQSEVVLQPPHLPPLHVPVLQSELVLHEPHLPPEHLPWPLQSELVLHEPHLPPEHLPKPAQSELVLHAASSCGLNRSSIVIDGRSVFFSFWNTGEDIEVTVGFGSPPHAARNANTTRRSFMAAFIPVVGCEPQHVAARRNPP
jgi:hypothetical protein